MYTRLCHILHTAKGNFFIFIFYYSFLHKTSYNSLAAAGQQNHAVPISPAKELPDICNVCSMYFSNQEQFKKNFIEDKTFKSLAGAYFLYKSSILTRVII